MSIFQCVRKNTKNPRPQNEKRKNWESTCRTDAQIVLYHARFGWANILFKTGSLLKPFRPCPRRHHHPRSVARPHHPRHKTSRVSGWRWCFFFFCFLFSCSLGLVLFLLFLLFLLLLLLLLPLQRVLLGESKKENRKGSSHDFIEKKLFTPPKTNMTMEHPPSIKMHFLLKHEGCSNVIR